MDYELAKELNKKGFPQHLGENQPCQIGCDQHVCFPTLEELIEACGDEFSVLNTNKFDGGWSAYNNEEGHYDPETSIRATGRTPTEAVAKLWLELNA